VGSGSISAFAESVAVGASVSSLVGASEGAYVGAFVGLPVGDSVTGPVGACEGVALGSVLSQGPHKTTCTRQNEFSQLVGFTHFVPCVE
jgi:hypothetical protein